MKHLAIVAIVVTAIVAAAAPPAGAQQARIGIYSDEFLRACEFELADQYTVGTAYVVLANSVDLERLRFKVSLPPCNMVFFNSQQVPPGYTYAGQAQDGIDITLDGCTNGFGNGIELVRITYIMLGSGTEACQWQVEPYPGDDTIQIFDCNGYIARGASSGAGTINEPCLTGENLEIVGYRPTPADGAVGVPTNGKFDWIGYASDIYLADHSFDTVIPGHDHSVDDHVYTPPPGGPYDAPKPFDPGPLEPNTTYHWYIQSVCYGCWHGDYAFSERWTFTTADAVSSEKTSWGQIKALYR